MRGRKAALIRPSWGTGQRSPVNVESRVLAGKPLFLFTPSIKIPLFFVEFS
jgi:hypothetical protein